MTDLDKQISDKQISDKLSENAKKLVDVLMSYARGEGNVHAMDEVVKFVESLVEAANGPDIPESERHLYIEMRLVMTLGTGLRYGNWLWLL